MTTNVEQYKQAVKEKLDALNAHDAETGRLHAVAMTLGQFPPIGTFPARQNERYLLSARLETSVEMLLLVLP